MWWKSLTSTSKKQTQVSTVFTFLTLHILIISYLSWLQWSHNIWEVLPISGWFSRKDHIIYLWKETFRNDLKMDGSYTNLIMKLPWVHRCLHYDLHCVQVDWLIYEHSFLTHIMNIRFVTIVDSKNSHSLLRCHLSPMMVCTDKC